MGPSFSSGISVPPLILIQRADPRAPEAVSLLAALTRELADLYADRGDDGGAGFDGSQVLVPRAAFLIGWSGGEAVGCGALRPHTDEAAAVKRMFTVPSWRGRGVAGRILAALEEEARAYGYRRVVLETGNRQPEAVRAYERAGYRRILPYAVYADWVGSRCYEKSL